MPRGDNFRNSAFQQTMHKRMVDKYPATQRQEWSRRGWQVTLEKYGLEFVEDVVSTKARQHRLEHPSQPEKNMIEILDGMGLRYEREKEVVDSNNKKTRFAMDFYLPDTNQSIEVDSGVHRIKPEQAAERWARKSQLLDGMKVQTLHIEDREMKTPAGVEQVKQKIAAFVQEGHKTLHERGQQPHKHQAQQMSYRL